MHRETTDQAITALLGEIKQRVEQAGSSAAAALACAKSGNPEKGVEVALDLEQPLYEASRLLDAASLLSRIRNEEESR